MTTVYKHGSCDDPLNDRPISVVAIIAKIPAVVSQLNSYCEDDQLMGPYQGTYKGVRSTLPFIIYGKMKLNISQSSLMCLNYKNVLVQPMKWRNNSI